MLGLRGGEEALFKTCFVNDMFLNFFQTRILLNQLHTFKLREYYRAERDLQLIFGDPVVGFINLVLEIVLASVAAVIAHAVNSNAIPFYRRD